MSYIPLKDCIKGGVYRIDSRNLSVGVYDGKEGFIGIRTKWSDRYLFTEYHFDQGPPYGTVMPEELIGMLPESIPVSEYGNHSNGREWAPRDGVTMPVIRRDLRPGELPHGRRQGFVDLWADTGERMPDKEYPYIRDNKALMDYLDAIKA